MATTQEPDDATTRRRISRPAKLTIGFLAASGTVGLAVTAYGLLQARPGFSVPRPAMMLAGEIVAASTLGSLLIRFVRWHYLLRRLEIRLQTPPSLGAFVGSFAFLPVPFYLGQLIARARLLAGVSLERRADLILVFLWERVLDVWALTLLATVVLPRPWSAILVVACALVLVPAVRGAVFGLVSQATDYLSGSVLDSSAAGDTEVRRRIVSTPVFVVSLMTSFGAWLLTVLSLLPLAWAAGVPMRPIALMGEAARSILLGALSLVPLGAGVAGMLLLRAMEALGAEAAEAAEVVMIYRAATLWLTVGLGGVALVFHRRLARRSSAHDHFDEIDAEYDAWLPEHFRNHVVTKKISAMLERMDTVRPHVRGLDIGCGRGWYLRELERHGARMVGIDVSARQLVAARDYTRSDACLVRGSVLGLPFRREIFDFAYIINVLHHMPTPAHQLRALDEIAALIRPGGLVFVHEMNIINPLFRFYLGYIFPILKGIEEGTEPYMDPRDLTLPYELDLLSVDFFSFIPDFVPASILPFLVPIERKLEVSGASRYAAHFMVTLRRK